MKRIAYLILSLTLFAFLTEAAPHDIRFSHIGLREGLSHATVNGIAQDRYGYIWVATPDGLNRYDGFRFTTFSPDSTDNNVRTVAADGNGQIWTATASSIAFLDDLRERFVSYPLPKGTHATAILPLEDGKVAVASDNGLLFWFRNPEYSNLPVITATRISRH